jgi:hypothetical protein
VWSFLALTLEISESLQTLLMPFVELMAVVLETMACPNPALGNKTKAFKGSGSLCFCTL